MISQEQLSYSYTLPATPYMIPRTPRVLSALITRRHILRHSYRAGLGGREARSVCRDRELVENGLDRSGSFSAPWSKWLFSLLRSGLLVPRIRALSTATMLTALSFETQRIQDRQRRGPLARIRLPSRDKCGAQRRAREVI